MRSYATASQAIYRPTASHWPIGLHIKLHACIHLCLRYVPIVCRISVSEEPIRGLAVPYQRMGTHLQTVFMTNLHYFVYCIKIDSRNIILRHGRRNIISQSSYKCKTLPFDACKVHVSGGSIFVMHYSETSCTIASVLTAPSD